ncbi:hypothetical protein NFI96_034386, partial [Prochilodus magdalenae]
MIVTATACVRYLKRNVEKNPRVTAKELKKDLKAQRVQGTMNSLQYQEILEEKCDG